MFTRATIRTNPKIRWLAAVGLLCSVIPFRAWSANCVTPPAGLVAWWPGEGNVNDIAGPNTGTLVNGATFAPGEVGESFSFDGTNSYIRVADSPSLHCTNALTIEAWVYPTSVGGAYHNIVSKWAVLHANQAAYTTLMLPDGRFNFAVSASGDGSGTVTPVVSTSSTNFIPADQWTHFAATYDGAALRTYINGVLEDVVAYNQGIFAATDDLTIGAAGVYAGGQVLSPFSGRIDEPSVYNRALPAAEIQAIYDAGSVGKCGLLTITGHPSGFSLAANQTIDIHGNNIATDSFDSADPAHSNNGSYPAGNLSKIKANGDVCTGTGLIDSLNVGNVMVMGSVQTGPGITSIYIGPNGSVGDLPWVEGGNLGVQPGHFFTNFNATFIDAVLPTATWLPVLAAPVVWTNGVTYQYSITLAGSYSLPGLTGSLLVNVPVSNAVVKLYITGNVTLSGNQMITIAPTGALLRIYMAGSSFSLSGNAFIDNGIGLANNFYLFGLPSCTSITFGGNAAFTGGIYAPNADFYLGGGGANAYDFVGASVTRTVTMNGHFNFHFDENLDRNPLFPPRILSQPQNQVVLAGSNTSFSITTQWATGLQWLHFGTNIIGATNNTLALTNVSPVDAGPYSVVLSNSVYFYIYSVTSSVATLTVYTTPAGNLSSPLIGTNGFRFSVGGVPGFQYAVEASTNLEDWLPLTTNIVPFDFGDTDSVNYSRRYYRSVWLP
jgi:hypothetical protein